MSELADLKPMARRRVIDLVREAGHDVGDWGDYARGSQYAASNPRYCYEWSFSQVGRATILNMWYAHIQEEQGRIFVTINIRANVEKYTGAHAKGVWRKRAEKLDDAIRTAALERAVVRVIVNDGRMRSPDDPKAKASSVNRRLLDPLPWTVSYYDATTGRCTLERGPSAGGTVDQFDVPAEGIGTVTSHRVSHKVFVRSLDVRNAARDRAGGKCELCRRPGFTRPDGSVYLETHHVVPLAENGPDVISNVVAVCATHHREAHFGARAETIRDQLLEYLSARLAAGEL